MSDTRVSDALRELLDTRGVKTEIRKAYALALELEQQVESLRAEQDGVRERIAQCGIDIEPRESTTDWLSQVLHVLLCSHGIVERLEAERDALLADKQRLNARIVKLEADLAEERETWFDGETTWNRPTAWAHAQACKLINGRQLTAEIERDALHEAIHKSGRCPMKGCCGLDAARKPVSQEP